MLNENEVINDLLGYDGLKIIQRPDMFNFSLDSTLLANFVTINKNTDKIVDLGTGNGPIPLFLSVRTKAKIIGIEIQKDAFELAKRNVKINNLEQQIEIINADLKNIYQKIGHHTFELVTSNPPYFKVASKQKVAGTKEIAKTEIAVNFEEIIKCCKRLICFKGSIFFIFRKNSINNHSFFNLYLVFCRNHAILDTKLCSSHTNGGVV
mgnify:CR=1 FL=1